MSSWRSRYGGSSRTVGRKLPTDNPEPWPLTRAGVEAGLTEVRRRAAYLAPILTALRPVVTADSSVVAAVSEKLDLIVGSGWVQLAVEYGGDKPRLIQTLVLWHEVLHVLHDDFERVRSALTLLGVSDLVFESEFRRVMSTLGNVLADAQINPPIADALGISIPDVLVTPEKFGLPREFDFIEELMRRYDPTQAEAPQDGAGESGGSDSGEGQEQESDSGSGSDENGEQEQGQESQSGSGGDSQESEAGDSADGGSESESGSESDDGSDGSGSGSESGDDSGESGSDAGSERDSGESAPYDPGATTGEVDAAARKAASDLRDRGDSKDVSDVIKETWKKVSEAVERGAKAVGIDPGRLEWARKTLLTERPEAKERNVVDELRRFVQGTVGVRGSGRSWARPDRRASIRQGIMIPGRRDVETSLLIVLDTSGSMWADLPRLQRLMNGLIRAHRATVMVGEGDAELTAYYEARTIRQATMTGRGGGGTRMDLVVYKALEKASRRPDGIVLITDGYTDYPDVKRLPAPFAVVITPDGHVPEGAPFKTIPWKE